MSLLKNEIKLSIREKLILKIVVQEYIKTAEPVSSKVLAANKKVSVSSATIRGVMSNLVKKGLLTQPHISSGRIPTELGFRFYVDYILEVGVLSQALRKDIDCQLEGKNSETQTILAICSKILSNITNHMGVVLAPFLTTVKLKQIYFVKISSKKLLAIVIAEESLVYNKVLQTAHDYEQSTLERINNYLLEVVQNLTVQQLRAKVIVAMGTEKNKFDKLFKHAYKLSALLLDDPDFDSNPDIYLEGRENLLNHPEFKQVETLKNIFNAFEDKRKLVRLLDEAITFDGVKVLIGSETETEGLALVAAPYAKGDNNPLGSLGIIGPQRLDYEAVIPVVDYMAKALGQMFIS